ncbi:MAG TPA: restriction endonuclease [Microlunatus sp.]
MASGRRAPRGAIRCGGFTVRVQPKVGAVQVLRLLARAHGVSGLAIAESLVDVQNESDLTAVLAVLFAEEAATAMVEGPLRGYRIEDQTASVLRGRIRMRDQELRRFGLPVPIEVTVDEWTADIIENRRIRAAARRLIAVPELPRLTRTRLQRLDHALAEVWCAPRGVPLAGWQPTRLNQRLHRLLLLADLVLDQVGVEHRIGDVDVHGYSLSMSWLFERLVTRVLSEAHRSVTVEGQRTFDLDEQSRLSIRPDLVLTRGGQVVGVADVKYKMLDGVGSVPNPDVYQLIAYCARLGLDAGHLVYASPWPTTTSRILNAGITVHVHGIDLSESAHMIEQRLAGVLAAVHRAAVSAL